MDAITAFAACVLGEMHNFLCTEPAFISGHPYSCQPGFQHGQKAIGTGGNGADPIHQPLQDVLLLIVIAVSVDTIVRE
jgi:hypothetical protein